MTSKNIYKKSFLESEEDLLDGMMSIEDFFKNYKDMTLGDLKEGLNYDLDEIQDDMGPEYKSVNKKIDKAQKDLNKEFDRILDSVGDDTKISDLLPGSEALMSDFEDEDSEEEEKTYDEHRHLPDFFRFVNFQYPDKTPKHDGKSLLGCERAIAWLQRLSNEISTNIRNDVDGVLNDNLDALSQIQESILTDIIVLKDHMKKLKSMLPEKAKTRKKAESEEMLAKFAATPNNMVITITPFIRAITGIIINSTVSAGKPFEDVYDYLVEKYEITEREQLEILQVLMDMGQPIFKDRGVMPGSKESKNTKNFEESLKGVDFITNYFA